MFLKKKTNDEVKVKHRQVYAESVPSLSTIKNWTAEFKCGRTSIFLEECLGCSTEVTTSEKIEKIPDILINDQRVKMLEIVEAIGISTECL